MRVGFKPTFSISNPLAGGAQQARHDEEGGRGEIARHIELLTRSSAAGGCKRRASSPSTSSRTPQLSSMRSL